MQFSRSPHRLLALALIAAALIYAFLAGLQTVADFDTGWFLATGRYVAQHHQIPSTDVFSYTAKGKPWIYSPFSGLALYLLFLAGGFVALSWLNAAACLGTTAMLVRSGGRAAALLAILAVPMLASRTSPRGEMFTTVFFATFVVLLWQHFEDGAARLWLLPLLMIAWVNTHPGFVVGLALLAAYIGLEVLELPFSNRRGPALSRLRTAAPWLAATVAATLVNPWGPRFYAALARLLRNLPSSYIGESSTIRINAGTLEQALRWRDPASAYWWLLLATLVTTAVALWRKQLGAAAWLLVAACFSTAYLRFQAMFAIVAVVVGGSIIESAWTKSAEDAAPPGPTRPSRILVWSLSAAMLATAMLRSVDLATDRTYLATSQISLFGTGLSWWYPERAMDFLLREHLPGNVFHDYDLGGYLTLKIGPEYPDYIDGRALPFGVPLFQHQRQLLQQPPDSLAWQQEADRWGINTLVFSTARYAGLSFPLDAFCRSRQWRPVFLDDTAIILLRNTPQNSALIQRWEINCATAAWAPPSQASADSNRGRAELYNFYANNEAILYLLARDREAWENLQRAEQIFPADPNLHLAKGQLLQAEGKTAEAEAEYRQSISLRPTDLAWYALGRLLAAEHRYPDAANAISHAAQLSLQWWERYRLLGQIYVAMNDPASALAAFTKARGSAPALGDELNEFHAQVAEGEARAWRSLGDSKRAIDCQREALRYTPQVAGRWLLLAELLQQSGDSPQADQARAKAEALRSAAGALPPDQK